MRKMANRKKSDDVIIRNLERAMAIMDYVNSHPKAVNKQTEPILRELVVAAREDYDGKKLLDIIKKLVPMLPAEASMVSRTRGLTSGTPIIFVKNEPKIPNDPVCQLEKTLDEFKGKKDR